MVCPSRWREATSRSSDSTLMRATHQHCTKEGRPPQFEDPHQARAYWKGQLAAGFRIFAKNGYDEGVAGHITLRDPVEPDTFWVNPFGTAFGLMKSSDLIRVDEEGNVLEGGKNRLLNNAAFMIHSAIHRARPDVNAACHSECNGQLVEQTGRLTWLHRPYSAWSGLLHARPQARHHHAGCMCIPQRPCIV